MSDNAATHPSGGSIYDAFHRPLRDLRISVTDRCNFRCPYCMPAEIYGDRFPFLPKAQILTFEEITRLARIFVGLGTNKLRITGGEPLIRKDLPHLIQMLADLGSHLDLTLTTNAYHLADQASALKQAGLQRVTVSLDSLDETIYRKMNGRDISLQRALEGIQRATEIGLAPIKINVVVQKGVNDHTIVDVARAFKGTGHVVRFIEFMDVGTLNGWNWEQVVPGAEVHRRIHAEMPLEPVEPEYRGEVAKRYRYHDGTGEIGLITSVSQPFCGDCTRARLSTDGKLYTCLFATGGMDLRTPLRDGASDEELARLVTGRWRQRVDRYSEQRHLAPLEQEGGKKVEMFQMGG